MFSSYTVLVRRYQNQGIPIPQPAGTPEPSLYSATDDDDVSYGSSVYDDPLLHTHVSTPETPSSWPTGNCYSGWTSQESFHVVPSTASNYPHIQRPLSVNVTQGSQWDWAATSLTTHSPMMALASPRAYTSIPDHNTLSPYDNYATTPLMLSPTTMNYAGHVARGPTSSPISSTASPSYQDPHAMAPFMRYDMRRDPPYQY